MLTLRPSVKSSTYVPQLTRVSSLQSPSSAPMELSLTRTTSSATGGSTLTAQRLRDSTHWTTRLLPSEKNLQLPLLMLCPPTQQLPLFSRPLPLPTCQLTPKTDPADRGSRDRGTFLDSALEDFKSSVRANFDLLSCFVYIDSGLEF